MESISRQCSVQEAFAAIEEGNAQFVDVRESSEFETERVEWSRSVPLSRLTRQAGEVQAGRPVYLLCRSGRRAEQAAHKFREMGHEEVWVVKGGIQAWIEAGLPVQEGTRRVWAMERQVRMTAGLLVMLGIGLSFVWEPFLILSGFVGAGLVFSAVTDSCGMAHLLARMPWNQASTTSVPNS